ncbi:MAG: hypothetical protein BWX71_02141 [Deltaproteobacteria bacterium ADurb.Bin072]|nr:MAG: hypothetical protein BWX71_02141 [Deltaproteobacteria bacterium ADurb.Bin072]
MWSSSRPRISTSEVFSPISSSASLSAVKKRSGSDFSALPPGKEISPLWCSTVMERLVTRTTGPLSVQHRGTSTADSFRLSLESVRLSLALRMPLMRAFSASWLISISRMFSWHIYL